MRRINFFEYFRFGEYQNHGRMQSFHKMSKFLKSLTFEIWYKNSGVYYSVGLSQTFILNGHENGRSDGFHQCLFNITLEPL
jgi:hypothetical protein